MNSNAPVDHPHSARRRWMAVLARAPAERLQALLLKRPTLPSHVLVRGPEVGLVMVRGRMGGSGAAFNLGEMTVTRCTVRTETGHVGHAYVAGRNERHAELAAMTDALMQDPGLNADIQCDVIAPLERLQMEEATQRARKAAATRVQFLAMQTMRT